MAQPTRPPYLRPVQRTLILDTPILPWRFVVGAALHLIVPAWVATLAVTWLAAPAPGVGIAALLPPLITLSGRFLLAYAGLTAAAALAARVLDGVLRARRTRRAARDPAVAARARRAGLTAALDEAARLLAPMPDGTARALAALGALADADDAAALKLGDEVTEMVAVFARALASAAPERRPALAVAAADALADLARAADAISADEAARHETEARTLARYVEVRYGEHSALELSGPPPGGGVSQP